MKDHTAHKGLRSALGLASRLSRPASRRVPFRVRVRGRVAQHTCQIDVRRPSSASRQVSTRDLVVLLSLIECPSFFSPCPWCSHSPGGSPPRLARGDGSHRARKDAPPRLPHRASTRLPHHPLPITWQATFPPPRPTAFRSLPAHGKATATVCSTDFVQMHGSRDLTNRGIACLALHLLVLRGAALARGRVPAEHRRKAAAAAGSKHLRALTALGLEHRARRAARTCRSNPGPRTSACRSSVLSASVQS